MCARHSLLGLAILHKWSIFHAFRCLEFHRQKSKQTPDCSNGYISSVMYTMHRAINAYLRTISLAASQINTTGLHPVLFRDNHTPRWNVISPVHL